MSATTVDDRARYRANPTVLQALKNPRMLTREVLAGLVVGLALIPEAIAFSVIAGVDPKVSCIRSSPGTDRDCSMGYGSGSSSSTWSVRSSGRELSCRGIDRERDCVRLGAVASPVTGMSGSCAMTVRAMADLPR